MTSVSNQVSSAAWGITLPGTAPFFTTIGFPGVPVYPVFLIVASTLIWFLGDGAAAMRRSNFLAPRSAAA